MTTPSTLIKLTQGLVDVAKPVLETACNLIDDLLGEPCKVAGQMLADQVYSWQWRNRIRIAHRAKEIMDREDVATQVLPKGFLVPLLDKAGNVEDPELQEMWARLLASAVVDPSVRHPAYVNILSQLSRNEAVLLSSGPFYFIRGTKNDEERKKLLEWFRTSKGTDIVETSMTDSEMEFYQQHIRILKIGDVTVNPLALFNHRFESIPIKDYREFPPPNQSIEEKVEFKIMRISFLRHPFGTLFMKACCGPGPWAE